MNDDGKRIPAKFYRTEQGAEPVRDWLKGLKRKDRRSIGIDIKTVKYGWPVGMPVCRPIGQGLYEVRTNLTDGRIGRVLFCISQGEMVLLHAFMKKSRRTPKSDLDLALSRKRRLERA